MIKTASEEVHSRIRQARAVIAAGVRLKQPRREAHGRALFAEATIENLILVHAEHLDGDARARLAHLLFDSLAPAPTPSPSDLAAIHSLKTPADMVPPRELPQDNLYDPDDEYEEDEPGFPPAANNR